jgi:hypothetical protein
VFVMLGIFAVIMGLAALFNDDVFVVSEDGLLVFDFTVWGVIHLAWGSSCCWWASGCSPAAIPRAGSRSSSSG